jgi:hypothetical protein
VRENSRSNATICTPTLQSLTKSVGELGVHALPLRDPQIAPPRRFATEVAGQSGRPRSCRTVSRRHIISALGGAVITKVEVQVFDRGSDRGPRAEEGIHR